MCFQLSHTSDFSDMYAGSEAGLGEVEPASLYLQHAVQLYRKPVCGLSRRHAWFVSALCVYVIYHCRCYSLRSILIVIALL